jgi:hypothetical protein
LVSVLSSWRCAVTRVGGARVEFTLGCGNRGNYAQQWWRDAATQRRATPIRISSGAVVSHVDAALPPGATVSGLVRAGGSTGKRLSGICVFGESRTGPFATATTASNGSYKLVGLVTGTYRLYFLLCRNRGNYLPLTRSVRVTTGQSVAGFDAFLQAGAIVSGKVTDAHGTPVRGICVQVQGPGFAFAGATTGADGDYSINALPSGSYTVQFVGGCGNAGSYAPQYYNGQTNSAAADPVPLMAGQTTAGVDAAMRPGGTITGVVIDNAGSKLSNVCISLAGQAEAQSSPFFFGGSVTFTKKGVFTARNLVPGLYAVNFGCGSRATASSPSSGSWHSQAPTAPIWCRRPLARSRQALTRACSRPGPSPVLSRITRVSRSRTSACWQYPLAARTPPSRRGSASAVLARAASTV